MTRAILHVYMFIIHVYICIYTVLPKRSSSSKGIVYLDGMFLNLSDIFVMKSFFPTSMIFDKSSRLVLPVNPSCIARVKGPLI